jgi:hypothetical protein
MTLFSCLILVYRLYFYCYYCTRVHVDGCLRGTCFRLSFVFLMVERMILLCVLRNVPSDQLVRLVEHTMLSFAPPSIQYTTSTTSYHRKWKYRNRNFARIVNHLFSWHLIPFAFLSYGYLILCKTRFSVSIKKNSSREDSH